MTATDTATPVSHVLNLATAKPCGCFSQAWCWGPCSEAPPAPLGPTASPRLQSQAQMTAHSCSIPRGPHPCSPQRLPSAQQGLSGLAMPPGKARRGHANPTQEARLHLPEALPPSSPASHVWPRPTPAHWLGLPYPLCPHSSLRKGKLPERAASHSLPWLHQNPCPQSQLPPPGPNCPHRLPRASLPPFLPVLLCPHRDQRPHLRALRDHVPLPAGALQAQWRPQLHLQTIS